MMKKNFNRRQFLQASGIFTGSLLFSQNPLRLLDAFASDTRKIDSNTLLFENGERPLVQYPQKRPLLRLTSRPPQLETPFTVFNEGIITPNDAFFVRYHLSGIPTLIDPENYRLNITGNIKSALSLSLKELKRDFEAIEITAVNQCSGNSRGFFQPRVPGGQLGNGAMGNAKWKGVPLKALLQRAGVTAQAKEVTFQGLDRPVLPQTPAFIKSLPIDHALDGEVLVAYEMNGEDLPFLNGYPLRLVVPGFYGTYWMKHLSQIEVIDHSFQGFWMQTAYRIPDNPCACTPPGTPATKTIPIHRLSVRSFITNLQEGQVLQKGNIDVKGIAFDGGSGIKKVELSLDDGSSWTETTLEKEISKYSFRGWKTQISVKKKGQINLKVRATNRLDQTQPLDSIWNPSGYMRNQVESVKIAVT